jgi:uncharacterized protein YwgA
MTTKKIKSFPVEDMADLLVVLLYAPGRSGLMEPISGITRLQKLVFLLQQNIGPGAIVDDAKSFIYQPYKMGPFSKDLLETLEQLKAVGVVVSKRLEYWISDDADDDTEDDDLENDLPFHKVESLQYSLSDGLGQQVGEGLWEGLKESQKKEFKKFKSFFNSLSLRQLLIYTYERFPKYAKKSTIRRSLGLSD